MGAGDLTTLLHVKAWLGLTGTDSDALLLRLIRSASAFALNYMQRTSLALTQYDDVYDGNGNNFMMLRQYPVSSVLSMSFNGTQISAARGDGVTSPYTDGWVLESSKSFEAQQRITLFGRVFPRGRSLVTVSYKAGYLVSGEQQTIPTTPTDGKYAVTTYQTWLADENVVGVDGTDFISVSDTPDVNQYSVDADGVYQFNAANAGQAILISYSFVPPDIEQAIWEMVSERFRYMDRIGVNSKSLGGQETVSFSQKSMSDYVRELLNPFKRVAPV